MPGGDQLPANPPRLSLLRPATEGFDQRQADQRGTARTGPRSAQPAGSGCGLHPRLRPAYRHRRLHRLGGRRLCSGAGQRIHHRRCALLSGGRRRSSGRRGPGRGHGLAHRYGGRWRGKHLHRRFGPGSEAETSSALARMAPSTPPMPPACQASIPWRSTDSTTSSSPSPALSTTSPRSTRAGCTAPSRATAPSPTPMVSPPQPRSSMIPAPSRLGPMASPSRMQAPITST